MGLSNCHQIIRCFGFVRGFFRVNMQPSCLSRVQNVSPSEARRTFAGKTHMFRRVVFSWGVFLGLVVIFSLFGWFCGVVCCVVWVYFENYRVFVDMFFGNQVIYVCGRLCRVVCCSLCVI